MLYFFGLFSLLVAVLNTASGAQTTETPKTTEAPETKETTETTETTETSEIAETISISTWYGKHKIKVLTPASVLELYLAKFGRYIDYEKEVKLRKMYDKLIDHCQLKNLKRIKGEELEKLKDMLYSYLFAVAKIYYECKNQSSHYSTFLTYFYGQVCDLMQSIKYLEYKDNFKADEKDVPYDILSKVCSHYGEHQEITVTYSDQECDHFMDKRMLPTFLKMITSKTLQKEDRLCFARLFDRYTYLMDQFSPWFWKYRESEDQDKLLGMLKDYLSVLQEQSLNDTYGEMSFFNDMKTDCDA